MIEVLRAPHVAPTPRKLFESMNAQTIERFACGATQIEAYKSPNTLKVDAYNAQTDLKHQVHMAAYLHDMPMGFDIPAKSRLLHLSLSTANRLALDPLASPYFRAGEFVTTAIEHFDSMGRIEYCEGQWYVGTNHDAFFQALGQGAPEHVAAASTWTGAQLARHGFELHPDNVRIIDSPRQGPSGCRVFVLFHRTSS